MTAFTRHTLGGYLLEEHIGEGSRGTVYRATQMNLGREVAIKVFPWTADSAPAARFVREAQILARLNHPHLVQIYDAGQQNDLLYFVMEYVPGPTIRSLLTLDGRLPPHLAVEYIAQAAEAIDVAYQETHVLHRNLTANNLMLDWCGRLKVMDFSLASIPDLPPITAVSPLVGSLASASPERLQGHPLDHRSDIYALGVVLYEMLTGSCPFVGRTPQEVMQAILAGAPSSLRLLTSEISPELESILLNALARDRDARFARASMMARALRTLHLSPPATIALGAFQELGTAPPSRSEEHTSRGIPKHLTLPMRDPQTPVPGILTPLSESTREHDRTHISSAAERLKPA